MTQLLRQRNDNKLGQNVYYTNLKPIETCPDSTAFCRSICYATSGTFTFPNVKNALERDTQLAQTNLKQYFETIQAELDLLQLRNNAITVRLHQAGDFFSIEYMLGWLHVFENNLNVTFYAYTRAHHDKTKIPLLMLMNKLENVRINLSLDKGHVNKTGFRTTLVVDKKQNTPDGYVACPQQENKNLTCDKCRLCINKNANINIAFVAHGARKRNYNNPHRNS